MDACKVAPANMHEAITVAASDMEVSFFYCLRDLN